MNVTNVSLSILVTVKLEDLDSHSAAARGSGRERTGQAGCETTKKKIISVTTLHWISFSNLQLGVDPDLLDAADNLAWLATRLVREEVRNDCVRFLPVYA